MFDQNKTRVKAIGKNYSRRVTQSPNGRGSGIKKCKVSVNERSTLLKQRRQGKVNYFELRRKN